MGILILVDDHKLKNRIRHSIGLETTEFFDVESPANIAVVELGHRDVRFIRTLTRLGTRVILLVECAEPEVIETFRQMGVAEVITGEWSDKLQRSFAQTARA